MLVGPNHILPLRHASVIARNASELPEVRILSLLPISIVTRKIADYWQVQIAGNLVNYV
jgi:hypothetical protein